MAKIPRIEKGNRPSAVPGGPLPGVNSGAAPAIAAFGNLAEVGYKIAADAEEREMERLRLIQERKQAIVNEVEAGRRAGDYEEGIVGQLDDLKKQYAEEPDKVPQQLLEGGRVLLDRQIEQAPNTQIGLEMAQRGNTRLMAAVREAHDWVQARQTQKIKGDLEAQKNQLAVNAGRFGSTGQLDDFLKTQRQSLFPQYEKVFGVNASKEWNDTVSRAAESYARVQGDIRPVSLRAELSNPRGALATALTPQERDTLITRTERALEKRGETRQYDILGVAAGKTVNLVDALNSGELDPAVLIAHQHENTMAQKAAAIDPSFSPEQRREQVRLLKRQGEVLDAIDGIFTRGQKFDPLKMAVNDAAALKDADKALAKFKGKVEQLPLLVEQMERLTLARKKGEISNGGYASAFGHIGLAYKKALSDEADNDGFWIFQNSRESANREMTRLLETRAQNASEDKKASAWVAYMQRYVEASKKGDVNAEAARRMARQAISIETGFDVRIKGD